jgi:hypothetical protein
VRQRTDSGQPMVNDSNGHVFCRHGSAQIMKPHDPIGESWGYKLLSQAQAQWVFTAISYDTIWLGIDSNS